MIPTKTIIPHRPAHLIHRPRLVDSLHEQVARALTLVVAPAGYGKTSLLVDFTEQASFPICWLSLDADDRDVSTFAAYMVAALQRCFPEFGRVTNRVLGGSSNLRPGPAPLASALIQDMLDAIPGYFVLILDDYYLVEDSAEVNALLRRLLIYRPAHMHLVLTSRTAPAQLPAIELAARLQIGGVGPDDLAFTADEIRAYLAQAHNVFITDAEAAELAATSEGWITAILLSTGAMWRGIRDNLIQARAQEAPLYTYLAEQVLAEQPVELQAFLLASSTLHEMNEALCRELLGLSQAKETLQEIERRRLFVTPVGDQATGTWYRYHHLFREFLQQRLQAQDVERFQQLHARAAAWYQAEERWERAVHHRLQAGDARATAQAMDAALSALLRAGRMQLLVDWYEAVPDPLRSEFPRLLLFAGRALNNLGRLDEAVRVLRRAEAEFSRQGETERALFAALARADTWWIWGKQADMLTLTEAILEQAVDFPWVMADAHRLAGHACLDLGRTEAAVAHFQTGLSLHRELGIIKDTAMAYTDLSLALLRLGRLAEGWSCQDRAIELYRQIGPSGEFAIMLNNVAYERFFLTGDYSPTLEYLDEAARVAQAAGVPRAELLVMLTRADMYRDLGALDQAEALYSQAQALAQRLGHTTYLYYVTLGKAQARLLAGNMTEALGLATQAWEQAGRFQDVYQLGLAHLTLAAVYLDAGHPASQALDEARQGCEHLTQIGARRDLTRGYLLLARALYAGGDAEQALAALHQAVDAGIGTQTFHYLIVEGQRAYGLFKQMQAQNPADRRVAEIMGRIRAFPRVVRRVIGGLAPGALPFPPSLRFYGFGPGQLERDGELVSNSAWHSAMARHLVFYLLVHPPQSREQILGNCLPGKAKSTFHVVKSQARDALGRALIEYQDGRYTVELEPDCWFDVAAFESLLSGQDHRQARLEAAAALYRGDFLEEHDAEWTQHIREHLRKQCVDALLELGEIHLNQDNHEAALARLNRALAMDNLYEPACRALMSAHALAGDVPAALAQYEQLAERLWRELQVEPDQETQAFYQSLRRGQQRPPP